jgi:hypothetical protein
MLDNVRSIDYLHSIITSDYKGVVMKKERIVLVVGSWGKVSPDKARRWADQLARRFTRATRRNLHTHTQEPCVELTHIDATQLHRIEDLIAQMNDQCPTPDHIVFTSRSLVDCARKLHEYSHLRHTKMTVLTGLIPVDEIMFLPKGAGLTDDETVDLILSR